MMELRRARPKGAVKKQLAKRGCQQVRAPDHFRYLHRDVVHDHGQLIRWNIIAPPNDKIAKIDAGDRCLRSLETIEKSQCFPMGNPETPVRASRSRGTRNDRESGPASPWVKRLVISRVGRAERSLDIPAGAITRVDMAAGPEPFPGVEIERPALALGVRSKETTRVPTFVPIDPEPAQILNDAGDKFRPAPIAVQVFDPQDQFAAAFTRPLERRPKGPGMAQMQKTGGRWRDASTVR